MNNIVDYLLQIHASADWAALIQIYGFSTAFVIIALLLLLHSRSRQAAIQGQKKIRELGKQVADLQASLERMESSLSSDIENSMTQKMNRRLDGLENRMQELNSRQSEELDKRTSNLKTRISEVEAEIRGFERHLDKVEKRMPSVFDRLEDFQRALTKGYQNELSNVFDSFDNAVGAVLGQMKNELKTSLNRIDGIEEMVDRRRDAEESFGIGGDNANLAEHFAPDQDSSESETAELGVPDAEEETTGSEPEPNPTESATLNDVDDDEPMLKPGETEGDASDEDSADFSFEETELSEDNPQETNTAKEDETDEIDADEEEIS